VPSRNRVTLVSLPDLLTPWVCCEESVYCRQSRVSPRNSRVYFGIYSSYGFFFLVRRRSNVIRIVTSSTETTGYLHVRQTLFFKFPPTHARRRENYLATIIYVYLASRGFDDGSISPESGGARWNGGEYHPKSLIYVIRFVSSCFHVLYKFIRDVANPLQTHAYARRRRDDKRGVEVQKRTNTRTE